MLGQVRRDAAGPWVPLTVPAAGTAVADPLPDRDNLYDGLAGLAPALAEVRLVDRGRRPSGGSPDEVVARLAEGDTAGDASLYVGLAGSLTAVALLDPPAADGLLGRLADGATRRGWPSPSFGGQGAPVNDLVLGNAGVVLACVWVGGALADDLAAAGSAALVATARPMRTVSPGRCTRVTATG